MGPASERIDEVEDRGLPEYDLPDDVRHLHLIGVDRREPGAAGGRHTRTEWIASVPTDLADAGDHVRATSPSCSTARTRLAILATVARLAPVALEIEDHEIPAVSIFAIPEFRATSSTRPL